MSDIIKRLKDLEASVLKKPRPESASGQKSIYIPPTPQPSRDALENFLTQFANDIQSIKHALMKKNQRELTTLVNVPNQNNYSTADNPFVVSDFIRATITRTVVLKSVTVSAVPWNNFTTRRVATVAFAVFRGNSRIIPINDIIDSRFAATGLPAVVEYHYILQDGAERTFLVNEIFEKGQPLTYKFVFQDGTAGSGVTVLMKLLFEW